MQIKFVRWRRDLGDQKARHSQSLHWIFTPLRSVEGDWLAVESDTTSLTLDLNDFDRIVVLGTSKPTTSMAMGLQAVRGDRISEGMIVFEYRHTNGRKSYPDMQAMTARTKIVEEICG